MRKPASPVVMPVATAAAAFGLTIAATKQFIRDAGIAQGDRVEIGALASHIARSTIGSQDHVPQAA